MKLYNWISIYLSHVYHHIYHYKCKDFSNGNKHSDWTDCFCFFWNMLWLNNLKNNNKYSIYYSKYKYSIEYWKTLMVCGFNS